MNYISKYDSPIGEITLISDGENLTGLYIKGQTENINEAIYNDDLEIFYKTKEWLNKYFSGIQPRIKIPIKLEGTEFRRQVWDILLEIPYGKTITYGDIAKKIALKRNIKRMSAQAVGGAVGHNPISIIVPCHRVIGSKGSLTGYAGGIDLKIKLLEIEKVK